MTTSTQQVTDGRNDPYPMSDPDGVVKLPVSALVAGDSPRLNGVDTEHIGLLAASQTPFPPILVHRGTMQVIDGMHRLRAALLMGCDAIEAEFFDGNEDEAFVAAVKANIAHGLPLTLADREAAAARILAQDPQRSDRWIACAAGLAPATVAGIRRRTDGGDHEVTARIGRDGRVRPLDSADGRRIAQEVITQNPKASLREIAAVAGISPTTVRDVRERLRRGEDPVPDRRDGHKRSAVLGRKPSRAVQAAGRDIPALRAHLQRDPSLRFTESGRALLRWLDIRAAGPTGWQNMIDAAPSHCVYVVAELARRCADEWLDVARQLDDRLRGMTDPATRAADVGVAGSA
jgi:ParB-like chromosome segregation protein Spo0J